MDDKKRTEVPETSTTLLGGVADSQSEGVKSCFFAYLGILGVKNILRTNDSDQLRGLVEGITVECVRSIVGSNSIASDRRRAFTLIETEGLNARTASDSICVWTEKDETLAQFDDFLHILRRLMVCGYENELPLRGVVTYGELFSRDVKAAEGLGVENNSVYGEALVESRETEGQMDWSGVILTQKAWSKIEREFAKGRESGPARVMRSENIKRAVDLFNHYPYLVWYDVPFKKGKNKAIALNWNYFPDCELSEGMIEKAFAERYEVMDGDVKKKLLETILFYEYTRYIHEVCGFSEQKILPIPKSSYALSDL